MLVPCGGVGSGYLYNNDMTDIELCKKYVRQITQISSEVGIFEFGITAVWKDGQFDIEKKYTTNIDTVWEHLRFDALLINCRKQYVRGFEFKVNRNDFLQDKKWEKYLKYCNTFTFVCPPQVIKKGELPKGVGLVYVESHEGAFNPASSYIIINRIHNCRSKLVHQDVYIELIRGMLMKAKFRTSELI